MHYVNLTVLCLLQFTKQNKSIHISPIIYPKTTKYAIIFLAVHTVILSRSGLMNKQSTVYSTLPSHNVYVKAYVQMREKQRRIKEARESK